MKKFSLKKVSLAIIIGFILSATIVYASEELLSKNFSYNNSNSSLTSTNLQDAIDELADKSKEYCPSKYVCYKQKAKPEVGDYVQMTPTLASYQIDTSKTGYTGSESQIINPQELNLWCVLKVNDDGTIELISEYTSSTSVYFSGKTGYLNFVGYLNELASKYENSKYTIGSRYVGYNGQTEYITDTSKIDSTTAPWTSSTTDNSNESLGGGDILYQNDYDLMQSALGTRVAYNVNTKEANTYWLTSRNYYYSFSNYWNYYCRCIEKDGSLCGYALYSYISGGTSHNFSNALRPVVILKSDISYIPAAGIITDPFILG